MDNYDCETDQQRFYLMRYLSNLLRDMITMKTALLLIHRYTENLATGRL